VRSHRYLNHSGWQKILARVDSRWGKQRDRLRDCGAHRAIWVYTREHILHCAVFLQREELAQPAIAGFQVSLLNGFLGL
jgi:hypothetical protein